MAEIQLFNASGAAGTLSAPDKLANSNAKMALIHQVAVAEAAGRRQGTSSTLRRDEVRGSGVKIRKQKGTGRSRQGDKRVPHMRGGGVVHGPKPRDYSQDTPRKMRQSAFRTVLNSRLQNDVLFVLDGISMSAPKTKEIVTLLSTMQLTGKKVLLLTSEGDANITLSARNLPKVVVQAVNQTGITDVLRSEAVVCTRSAWDELSARIEGKGQQETSA
ncbi:MAG TPA: 50S ribosomal protein L4 [Abditibacteriaceae bacterium]|jgi:large subunit ribosomal protein L4|nr:50S ribosomal protein L4 [Abditibacteriaceae bacterium]